MKGELHFVSESLLAEADGVEALDGEFDVVHSPVPGT